MFNSSRKVPSLSVAVPTDSEYTLTPFKGFSLLSTTIPEIVNVSAGHARNYLITRGFAAVADEGCLKSVEQHQKMLSKKLKNLKLQAMLILPI